MVVIKTNPRGLIRAVVTIQQRGTSELLTAYTVWHDYNEEDMSKKLKEDTDRLINAYAVSNRVLDITVSPQYKNFEIF